MTIKESVNPVGSTVSHPVIDQYLATVQKMWGEVKQTAAWWKVWASNNPVPVTQFLLTCADELVVLVEQTIPGATGADKKATVLNAIGTIYDNIVTAELPVFLKPFSGQLRTYVVDVLASAAIDWMVAKYNNGNWQLPPATPAPAVSSTPAQQ